MSTQTQIIENAPAAQPPRATGDFQVSERLRDCAAKLREHIRGPVVSHWLKDNHALLQSQIADLRHAFRPSMLRQLQQTSEGEPRIYRIVAGWLANAPGVIDNDVLLPFAETLRETESLDIAELWAFAPMLKFGIVERLCANLDSERLVAGCVRTLWALQALSWKGFVETASRTEAALKQDPAGVYSRMDVPTRDRYRLELNRLASLAKLKEEDAAKAVLRLAEQARDAGDSDPRTFHVGYYLVGPGTKEFRRSLGVKRSLASFLSDWKERYPNLFYAAGVTILMFLLMWGFDWVAGAFPWWALGLLLIPASQAALEITNASFSRMLSPRFIPSMDFVDGIPDDSKTMVVVPTLLLSESNCTKLLKDLEIRYLANQDRNLSFALLTDFADASTEETPGDSVLGSCVAGIRQLNERYGSGESGWGLNASAAS
jgi:cyclic beta-1,2-glucan synthetase